jgi:hypothetical protein
MINIEKLSDLELEGLKNPLREKIRAACNDRPQAGAVRSENYNTSL